jgi:hypothetical protein
MMDKARKENEDDWHKRVERYIEGGLNEKEAKEKAGERMHSVGMKSFYQLYGSLLLSLIQLNGGPIHENVMSNIDKFTEKGYDNKQSIKMALHKELYKFEAMWDIDRYESGSDEDDMYEDDFSEDYENLLESLLLLFTIIDATWGR